MPPSQAFIIPIVFKGIKHLLDVRKTEAAFSPFSKQQILSLDDKLFALRRGNGSGSITAVINVSGDYIAIDTEQISLQANILKAKQRFLRIR